MITQIIYYFQYVVRKEKRKEVRFPAAENFIDIFGNNGATEERLVSVCTLSLIHI